MSDHKARLQSMQQPSAYVSPWSLATRVKLALWCATWIILFRPTPKFCAPWRVFLLRLFGATISGTPFVGASTRIKMPWHLTLEDRACLAPDCEVYNLARCIVRARATVTQRVYLCAGTHDLTREELPLVVGPIEIGEDAFIGAQAMILPGVRIGAGAAVGAGSVVTKDVDAWTIVAGNPAREIGKREHPRAS
jgi:putative colanic acid biosynthesis acetyltransferase WcaF